MENTSQARDVESRLDRIEPILVQLADGLISLTNNVVSLATMLDKLTRMLAEQAAHPRIVVNPTALPEHATPIDSRPLRDRIQTNPS